MKKNLIYYFLIFLLLSSSKLDEAGERGKNDGETKLKGSEIFSQIKSVDLLSPDEQTKNFDGEKAKNDILTDNINNLPENKVIREVIHNSSANKNQFSLPSEDIIEKANKISANPLEVLNKSGVTTEEYVEKEEILEDEIKKCDEPGDPYKLVVNRCLGVDVTYHPEVTGVKKICQGCSESYNTSVWNPERIKIVRICQGHSEEDNIYSGSRADDSVDFWKREFQNDKNLVAFNVFRFPSFTLYFGDYQVCRSWRHIDDVREYDSYRDVGKCNNYREERRLISPGYWSTKTNYRTVHHPENATNCRNSKDVVHVIAKSYYSEGDNNYQIDNISNLETGVSENCTLDRVVCIDKNPRNINGKMVNRPCWIEQQQYICTHPYRKECSVLRSKGCTEISSECIESSPYGCAIWHKTYQCVKSKKSSFKGMKSNMYGMDPKLFQEKEEVNNKFPEVLAKLTVFDEMKKDLEQGGERDVRGDIQIFKGLKFNCKKNICESLLYDCCGTMKGLANSLGLSKCSADEKSLAERRDKQLCHYVDREENKALGMWTSSYTLHFCCFSNRLNRVLQEEGRKQLALNWTRNCEGLSADQISKLDFSKIDFSEVAEEYQKKIEKKLHIKKSRIDNKFQNKDTILEDLQRKMNPNFKRVDK